MSDKINLSTVISGRNLTDSTIKEECAAYLSERFNQETIHLITGTEISDVGIHFFNLGIEVFLPLDKNYSLENLINQIHKTKANKKQLPRLIDIYDEEEQKKQKLKRLPRV